MVVVVIFITLMVNFFQKRITGKLYEKLKHTPNYMDDALIEALRRPLTFLIWIVGLSFASKIVAQKSQAVIFNAVDLLRDVGLIFTFAWFLVRLITRLEKNILIKKAARGEAVDRTTAEAIANYCGYRSSSQPS